MQGVCLNCHPWVYDGVRGLLQEIARHDLAIRRIQKAWDGFEVYLGSDTPPPLTDADKVVRTDSAWAVAARAYAEAKREAETAADRVEAARITLLALAIHPKGHGAGVAVTRFWKAGSVAYKNIPELKGVDFEAYWGEARAEVRTSMS